MTLEKRGYATAGSWTPEAAAEHPEAVEQLAAEFARAGADITQTFTFWCHEDALPKGCQYSVSFMLNLVADQEVETSRSVMKSTRLPVTLQRKYQTPEEP